MAKVKVFVWHNLAGNIVAIGQAVGGAKCVPVSSANEPVLEAEIEEAQLPKLHETHTVDISTGTLVTHSAAKAGS
jgi:hypothetical protein